MGGTGRGAVTTRHPRRGILVTAASLIVCAGLVYGVLTHGDEAPKRKAVPSAGVTYEVEGTGMVDITYRALDASGNADRAAVVKAARLPWKKSVTVPLGHDPVIRIALHEKGGTARCALAVRGRHVQSATASGAYGRAVCQGSLPAGTKRTDSGE
ncbi:hypothetical protein AB0436_13965 [Streptomyces sp. NPDC051322]|uniref:hypothetical protein n=1 Tax=Streptomyces sp. NPDC051322 TaxID=3154645 RepID=UPI00344CDC3D